MIAQNHILGTFDEALASLRNNVLMMSSLTERSLDRAVAGLLERDDELCVIAIADDEEIDQLEKQVDKDGVDLLLRFQPLFDKHLLETPHPRPNARSFQSANESALHANFL